MLACSDSEEKKSSSRPPHSGAKADFSESMEIDASEISQEEGQESWPTQASPPRPSEEVVVGDSKEDRKKLSRHDRIELARMFQNAVSSHDWELAESLVVLADPHTLNDSLCISLDSIWFLSTRQELVGITGLITKIIAYGARDFTRAALRTSFLASCVSACQSRTMSLTDTVGVMAQRLRERLLECHGDVVLKAEAGVKVQKFTDWALKCIGFHTRCKGNSARQGTSVEIQLQLIAFKTFLDLAGNRLTGRDFTEAFDAACFPLTLFSSSFNPGWATGVSAATVQGLLGLLVEGGADNVNQCFLEASRFGSTELVRVLLQIAQRNSLDVDVDLALGFASHYGKINTMECLVEEGNTVAFLGPLMRASERGHLEVVKWFVNRGCRDMELCLALTAATSSSQVQISEYLLPHVPQHILSALSIEILKAAGDRSGGSLSGVEFLLKSDFLGDPAATYNVANTIAMSDEEGILPELKSYLWEHWSESAFREGMRLTRVHHLNFMRILFRGTSPICLEDLPGAIRIAIGYLPLYKECVKFEGKLLSSGSGKVTWIRYNYYAVVTRRLSLVTGECIRAYRLVHSLNRTSCRRKSLPWEKSEIAVISSFQVFAESWCRNMEGFISALETHKLDKLRSMMKLIESATIPVIAVDCEGRVTEWNSKVAELTGLSYIDALNRQLFDEIILEDCHDDIVENFKRALQGQEDEGIEMKLQTFGEVRKARESAPLYIYATTCCSRDHAGNVDRVCFIGQDMAETKSVAKKFSELEEEFKLKRTAIIYHLGLYSPPLKDGREGN